MRSKNFSHPIFILEICTDFPSSEPRWSSCCHPALCTGCPTHHSLVGDPLGEHLVESPALPQNRAEHKGCPNAQHGQSHLRTNEDRSKSHSGTFIHLQHRRSTEDGGGGRKWASLNVPITRTHSYNTDTQLLHGYITVTQIHNCSMDTNYNVDTYLPLTERAMIMEYHQNLTWCPKQNFKVSPT